MFQPVFIILLFLFHPVHVSVTSIEYNQTGFDVSFKIFYDDFESIVAEKYNVRLNLGKPDEMENKANYFTRYISENFAIRVNNGPPLSLKFKSSKLVEKSIWLYFTLDCKENVNKVELFNRVMMDMYNDQMDLVMFKIGTFEEGYTFRHSKDKIEIDQFSN